MVPPSGHYFPVCHAEEGGEQRTGSRREPQWADDARMHAHSLLAFNVQRSMESLKLHLMRLHFAFMTFMLGSELVHPS